MKETRKALARLQRLTGRMGLLPANWRRVMTACIQVTAMFGAELWWKGKQGGTDGMAKELQVMVNWEARVTTGCFRTTNQRALVMESGLRPASNQLKNRQRRFGLRLLSLPQAAMAREIVGTQTAIGKRLVSALSYTWTAMEEIVLGSVPLPFEAEVIQEEREKAMEEATAPQPGLTMFTDGSRMEEGATGYAVASKEGQTWTGVKTYMGYNQEAFDAECATLTRALDLARRRDPTPARVTVFTDAQTAIKSMISDEPGPGQNYALEAREHIAALRSAAPDIIIEVRWCPTHKGVEGNDKADEWAKLAVEELDARGVEGLELFTYLDRPEERSMPLPRSLANIKQEISKKKWAEAWKWAGGRTSKKKNRMPTSQRPNSMVAGSAKWLAERFYQLKTGYCCTGDYLHWTKSQPTAQCWWCPHPRQTREHLLTGCPKWRKQQRALWKEVRKETGKGRRWWNDHEPFADRRCSQAVLNFLASTEVGKTVPAAGEDARSEASEWELRERAEREEERRAEALGRGMEREEHPLFLPTPIMALAGEE